MWTIEKQKAHASDQYRRCKKWFKRPWWFNEIEPIARFTGWVMAFTGVLVIVASLQFCTMNSTERWIADTMVAANRGWIRVNSINLESAAEIDAPIVLKLSLENVGHGPAKWIDVRTMPNTRTIPNKQIPVSFGPNRACDGFGIAQDAQIAWPGAQIEITQSPPRVFEKSVLSRESVLYIHGCIAYAHFENVSKTWFCFYLDPIAAALPEQWRFRTCRDGHDVS
jgi:hypothetical protein